MPTTQGGHTRTAEGIGGATEDEEVAIGEQFIHLMEIKFTFHL